MLSPGNGAAGPDAAFEAQIPRRLAVKRARRGWHALSEDTSPKMVSGWWAKGENSEAGSLPSGAAPHVTRDVLCQSWARPYDVESSVAYSQAAGSGAGGNGCRRAVFPVTPVKVPACARLG